MNPRCPLTRRTSAELAARSREPLEAQTLRVAADIVEDVRKGGRTAALDHARRLGDLPPQALPGSEWVDPPGLSSAFEGLPAHQRGVLERTADRVRTFAEAQFKTLQPLETPVPGGRAGHRWLPADTAGAYAPGGRYPLPSSVLMTVIPARVAGVRRVLVASPKPAPATLAAAHVAGADGLLALGGAQAIAALAFGTHDSPADVLVGPGNRFVTAAKKHLAFEVGIDGLAGPSELLIIADDSADVGLIAADLLAQAEHDPAASAILVTTSSRVAASIDDELERQLADLPTADVARESIARSGACALVADLAAAAELSDQLAPEHLELLVENPRELADRVRCYGGLFLGARSAEVFGDYGVGPNHVLPTGRGGRFQAGLSVMTFLRASTWLELEETHSIASDAAELARLEGLEGHARAALRR